MVAFAVEDGNGSPETKKALQEFSQRAATLASRLKSRSSRRQRAAQLAEINELSRILSEFEQEALRPKERPKDPTNVPSEADIAAVRSGTASRWPGKAADAPETSPSPGTAVNASPPKVRPAIIRPPDHQSGWQNLYLASELERGLQHCDAEYQAFKRRLAHRTSAPLGPNPVDDARQRLAALEDHARDLCRLLNGEVTQKALDGDPAEESMIRFISVGVIESYVSMMRWAQAARDAAVPNEWVPAYQALAEMADGPIRQFRAFVAECSKLSQDIVREIRSGRPQRPFKLHLTLDIDGAATAHFSSAINAISAHR